MVDFDSLRQQKTKKVSIRPQDIFRRLPKPDGINDLYESQGKVLTDWFDNRENKDTIIKLHTGGGKTLVGLLMAQSCINEKGESVLYLCPTQQLVSQTLEKAEALSLNAVPYVKKKPLDDDFINGKAIMVCTYSALFNGQSKFKLRGSSTPPIKVSAIILDDAHVAFSDIRDAFTLEIEPAKHDDLYKSMAGIFRPYFKDCGVLGTFDDTISGKSDSILEIPYWAWYEKIDSVQIQLASDGDDTFPFSWPILRDNLHLCHAIISKKTISITPYLPLVDLFPTFSEAPRRIYMSATIADDSEIIRTFDASKDFVARPLSSSSLAGISERMILIPALMPFSKDLRESIAKIILWTTSDKQLGSVVLTPSDYAAASWERDGFTIASGSSEVEHYVNALQEESTTGPIVFANRYDGIDLPGNSCRLLVMDGLPAGTSNYELFRATALFGGASINRLLAQRIEQGIGRGARGSGDHCVVILMGKNLAAWIGKQANFELLTGPTKTQIEIGITVSERIETIKELAQTINKSYSRDSGWVKYHAETLAEEIQEDQDSTSALDIATVERKAFNLWRDGYYEQAIKKLDTLITSGSIPDTQTYGWLRQLTARIACDCGKRPLSIALQKDAFSNNRNLLRPPTDIPYQALPQPTEQSKAIVKNIDGYTFRKSFIEHFDEATAYLNDIASSNQFEESLKNLGSLLGFEAERHDRNGDGPDVLWLLPHKVAFVIEAKSRKSGKNVLNKEEHGQLIIAEEWLGEHYPDYSCVRVSIYPTNRATKNAYAQESYALTYEKLSLLVSDARKLIEDLCDMYLDGDELQSKCAQILKTSKIKHDKIVASYLQKFIVSS